MSAAHWGTFTKPMDFREILSIGENAMKSRGMQIWDTSSDGDYVVIGGRGDLIVQVTTVPQGGNPTWVIVTAFSTDSSEAEQARNDIRTTIVNTVNFDS
jgi:hypothetical protein